MKERNKMTRKEAIEKLNWLRDEVWNEDSDGYDYAQAIDMAIESLSIEIVRCKDCVHAKMRNYAPPQCPYECTLAMNYHDGNHFCSLGERKEDARNGNH